MIRLKTAGANTYTYDSLARLTRIDFSNSVTSHEDSSRLLSTASGQLEEFTTYEYYPDKRNWLDPAYNEFDADNKPVKGKPFSMELHGAPL